MATYSSVLAWRIPWTEDPGGATIHGVARVGHDLATKPSQTLISTTGASSHLLDIWGKLRHDNVGRCPQGHSPSK